MDLISIIIPIYKIEDCLERCLNSVLNQTYSNLEIILVDDGSPDRCPAICDEWAKRDKRIRVIHKHNAGVSAARNTGLDIAVGEYILFVDGDDYVAQNIVERLYEAVKNSGAEIALCDFKKGTDAAAAFCEKEEEPEVIDKKTALARMYDNDHSAFQYVVPWGKLYQRSLFDGIRYPSGKIFEDMYITHLLINRCNKIAVLNGKYCYYYQRKDSIVNRSYDVRKLDYLDALADRIVFFKKHDYTKLAEVAYDEYLHSLIWEYSRARDILHDKMIMRDLAERFRKVYKRGYCSKRHKSDSRLYLWSFYVNPEIIVWYWRLSGKLKILFGKRYCL